MGNVAIQGGGGYRPLSGRAHSAYNGIRGLSIPDTRRDRPGIIKTLAKLERSTLCGCLESGCILRNCSGVAPHEDIAGTVQMVIETTLDLTMDRGRMKPGHSGNCAIAAA